MFKTLAGIAAIFIDIKDIKRTIISNIIDIPSKGPANKFDKIKVREIVLNWYIIIGIINMLALMLITMLSFKYFNNLLFLHMIIENQY